MEVMAFAVSLPVAAQRSLRRARGFRPSRGVPVKACAKPATLRPYLEALSTRPPRSLTKTEAAAAVTASISGEADPAAVGALLALLAAKGETAAEVAGVAAALRTVMVPADVGAEPTLDIVGTGGDGLSTVNISTAASVVAAAAGCRVAKHGNRSVSSKSGSADVLEELGVSLELADGGAKRCLDKAGIVFFFAPAYHPAMRAVGPARKALGVRTVFNLVGPLVNPGGCRRAVIGVYMPSLIPVFAKAIAQLGGEHVVVVHCDGMDEFSPTGVAQFMEVKDGVPGPMRELDPLKECGMARCSVEDLKGGDAEVNAGIIRRVLAGEEVGPVADAIALNAGVGCYVYGLDDSIASGVRRAMSVMENGAAIKTLDAWAAASQDVARVNV